MSKLSIGIVGLPNVGKSTLFNALLKKQQAYVANFPFATIEPNIGVVPVPDKRLFELATMISKLGKENKVPPISYTTIEFIDIAGIISGAHDGEGLGNKFLSHIRETDVICHVVRIFTDENIVREGSLNPENDLSIVETELALADLATLSKQQKPRNKVKKEDTDRWNAIQKIRKAINNGEPARLVDLTDDEKKQALNLHLLTMKPVLIVLNSGEDDVKKFEELEIKYSKIFNVKKDQVIAVSAKFEEELGQLPENESLEYLKILNIDKPSLDRLIVKAFKTLDLIVFLTVPILVDGPAKPGGIWEVKSWPIKKGTNAQEAAGEIHNDFQERFVKADVVSFEEIINNNGWKNCRTMGRARQEGKKYVVQDGDVIEFKFGS